MKLRQKLCLIFLMLAGLFMLCGCQMNYPIQIFPEELPPDAEIYVLVRPDDSVKLMPERDVPEELAGSEIALYEEEGWMPAPFVLYDIYKEQRYDSGAILLYYGSPDVQENRVGFCEIFKELRFAVTDKEGRILSVSDTFSLYPKDRFAHPVTIIFNAQTGQIWGTEFVSRRFLGKDPFDWWLLITHFSWISNIAVQVMISNSLKRREKGFDKRKKIIIGLLMIPGLLSLVSGLMFIIHPYFRTTDRIYMSDINIIVFMNLSFIISAALLLLLPLLRKTGWFAAKEKKTETDE